MKKMLVVGLTLVAFLSLALFDGATANAADKKAKKKNKGNVEALFKKLDTDNDGKLTAAEFGKIKEVRAAQKKEKGKTAKKADDAKKAKKAKKANKKKGNKLFGKLDANSDGSLTLDEFKKLQEIQKEKRAKKKAK